MEKINMIDRPKMLSGITYKAKYPNPETGDNMSLYVTINEHENKPFEVFIRLDDPKLFEWMISLTLTITRSLRAGEELCSIAKELLDISSPSSKHIIPGTNEECPSLSARIGKILVEHDERSKNLNG